MRLTEKDVEEYEDSLLACTTLSQVLERRADLYRKAFTVLMDAFYNNKVIGKWVLANKDKDDRCSSHMDELGLTDEIAEKQDDELQKECPMTM